MGEQLAVIPYADYKAACDSVRAKTGKTDLIKSGELSTEIDSISGGVFEDVNELPAVVDNSKIYRIHEEAVTEAIIVFDGEINVFKDFNAVLVDELPESHTDIDTVFVLKESGIGYIFYEAWYTIGQFMLISNEFNDVYLEDKGFITDEELAEGHLADGIYMYKKTLRTLGIPETGKTKIYEFENEWVRGDSDLVRGFLGEGLDELTIPYGMERIGEYACYNKCSGVTELSIPDTVRVIEKYAFNGIGIKNLDIPSSVNYIYEGAFNYSSIEHLVIRGTPLVFENAFANSQIRSVLMPVNLTKIRASAFDNTPMYSDDTHWENEVFYVGLHLMRSNAYCSGNLTVKSGTKIIAEKAFTGSKSIESVVFPEGVTHIGEYAFNYIGYPQASLKSLEFPSTVTNMGQGLINGVATETVSITVKATTPPIIYDNTFISGSASPSVEIYVPAESVDAYKTADGWSAYADVIFPIE